MLTYTGGLPSRSYGMVYQCISIFPTGGPIIQLVSDTPCSCSACGAISGHEGFEVLKPVWDRIFPLKNSCLLCWQLQPKGRGGVATTCIADATMKQLFVCLLHDTLAIMLLCTY